MTGPGRGTSQRGQASVEVALVLPLLAALALLLLQVGLLVRDQVLVTHAAREGARQAAVRDDPAAVAAAVADATALDRDRLSVEVSTRGPVGSPVRVEVTYRAPTDLPLVGHLLGDVELGATATMRVETPAGPGGTGG